MNDVKNFCVVFKIFSIPPVLTIVFVTYGSADNSLGCPSELIVASGITVEEQKLNFFGNLLYTYRCFTFYDNKWFMYTVVFVKQTFVDTRHSRAKERFRLFVRKF